MSGIHTVEGYRSAYENFGEATEEIRQQAKRSREAHSDEIDRMEKRHVENLRDVEKNAKETVKNVREDATEAREADRKAAREDVARLKKETYDMFGRYRGRSAESLKEDLDQSRKHARELETMNERLLKGTEEAHHRKVSDINDQHERELEETVKDARDSANAAYRHAFVENKEAQMGRARELEARHQKMEESRIEELRQVQDTAKKHIQDAENDFKNRLENTGEYERNRLEQGMKDAAAYATRNIETANRAHEEETNELRENVRVILDKKDDYARYKAKGLQDAQREVADRFKTELSVMQQDYEDLIDRMKYESNQIERRSAEKNNEILREKDKQLSQVFRRQNQENSDQVKNLEEAYRLEREQLEGQIKDERKHADARVEKVLENSEKNMNEFASKQSRTFNETLGREKEKSNSQIQALANEINRIETSGDIKDVSPAIVNKIERATLAESGKVLNEEKTKNQAKVDGLIEEYSDRYATLLNDSQTKEAKLRREFTSTQNLNRQKYTNDLFDEKAQKADAVRNLSLQQERMNAKMLKTFERDTRVMAQHYEGLIEDMKLEQQSKVQELIEKMNFNEKMVRREYAAQHGETVRKYENEMSAQREEYEFLIDEMKRASEERLADVRKESRDEIDRLQNEFQRKLAMNEQQRKERERFIENSYEEQLDQVRMANARLIRQKS